MAKRRTVPKAGTASNAPKPQAPKEPKIRTANLIASKSFKSQYQKDFMVALLPKSEYSVSEAKAILDGYFKKKGVS